MPEMDDDGYPTDATLDAIRDWPQTDHAGLLAFVREAWRNPEWGWREDEDGTLRLSTGGWSGNESIIDALGANTMFWMFWWQSSRRGGHYEFRSTLAKAAP
jgi:hypothetical protein